MEMRLVHVTGDAGVLAGRGKQMVGNNKVEREFVCLACLGDAGLGVIGLRDGHGELQERMSCVNASVRGYGRHVLDMSDGDALESNFNLIKSSSMWGGNGDLA